MVNISSRKINVIIPAYNESKNIAKVIEGIRKEFPNVGIIIVDDSVEFENKRTRHAIQKFKNILLITRSEKKGRGSAVLVGFKFGLRRKDALYFFEMDADQSHEPIHLKRFLENILSTKVDMVIGSRYIKGGSTGEISFKRIILSKIINKFLALMLNVKLSDYTSGFRLYSRSALEFLVQQDMKSNGFITLSEITYKLNEKGFKIGEVPVTITKRKYGMSTMGAKELISSFTFILKMKIEEDYLRKIKSNLVI